MRRICVVAALAVVPLLITGCPKKKTGQGSGSTEAPKPPDPKKTPPDTPAAGALAPDKGYASGKVSAAVLSLETKLDVPGLDQGPKAGDEVKAAAAASALKQAMMVSDERGTMAFTTEDSYIPKGTELRYNPKAKKYVLADPAKKQYWVMGGSELGNLLEGGPSMTRSNYSIEVKETSEKATVAGLDTVKLDATIGFDWKVKTKSGDKTGKIKVKLAIWHTADAKFKAPWGQTMIDFLTVPFQDADGQKVVDTLKSKVKFPVKWAMEVINEGAKKEDGEQNPKLVTTATSVEVKEVDKAGLAYPPAGFGPATGPYQFGDGKQTAKEELLGKVPPKPGKPPKDVDQATDDKDTKKTK